MKHALIWMLLLSSIAIIIAKKDHYQTLGVARDATTAEIKKAYRNLAVKYHPDKNSDDPQAEQKFVAIGAAYETLSDPEKRRHYDQFGDDNGPQGHPGGGQRGGPGGASFSFNGGDAFRVFEQFFGGSNPFGGGGGGGFDMGNMFGNMGGMGGMGGGQPKGRGRPQGQPQQPKEKPFQGSKKILRVEDSRKFEEKVMKNRDEVWLVAFYNDGAESVGLSKEMTEAANKLDGMVHLAALDSSKMSQLVQKYKVEHIPSLWLFPAGPRHDQPQEISGKLTAKDIVQFGMNSIPADSVKGIRKGNVVSFLNEEVEGVTLPKVILFTDKSTVPPLYKAVARTMKKIFSFGVVSPSEKDLVEQYHVEKFPTIFIFPADTSRDPIIYNGPISFSEIVKYLKKQSTSLPPAKRESDVNKMSISKSNFNSLCKPSSICLVVVGGDSQKQTTDVVKEIQETSNGRYHVSWLPKSQRDFLQTLGVEETKDIKILVLNRKRSRHSVLSDVSTKKKRETSIGGIALGDVTWRDTPLDYANKLKLYDFYIEEEDLRVSLSLAV
ncbi:hypothetical protein PROFUN_05714 [Planoprotostelium fungivorum]|uniref:DnaJ homolog subfamily C member 16 n=1 Tax=Planoprotostelium fungivorum TaxID=1890364 RepID=A0A2P6NQL7_9EUKA|nr:hypothetical protein PROFUN_05714 [Planoprotostelium fungivorum]